MSDDLVTWLRAQLDEDERVALAASPGPWTANAENDEVLAVDGITVAEGFALSGRQLRATVEHIARHDPARVLRDVEAKRRILDMCADWIAEPRVEDWEIDRAEELCLQNDTGPTLLRLLTLPYSDRDGYQEAWRP